MAKASKKFYLWVLGCQMNLADAERVAKVLSALTWEKTEDKSRADLIVVVACSVRQAAIDRIYSQAGSWRKKRQAGCLKTILTGCVLESDRKNLAPLFDFILPIAEINTLPKLLQSNLSSRRCVIASCFDLPADFFSDFSALVPISNGCNNFCSYCVVPYTRGREVSRDADSILKECQKLIADGYKEIILLGQNVNSYRSGRYDFPKLLKTIDAIPGDYWLRFLTSHPKDLSDELISAMVGGVHITPYLHLPIQSGDDQILANMNRKYTVKHYLDLIKKVRRQIPDLALSTDIIVGFPGETKAQFNNSAKLFKQVKFDMAYPAKYSPRVGTVAFKLKNNVSSREKKRRWQTLNEILKKTALGANQKYLNQTERVLVDDYKEGRCFAKTASYKTVIFAGVPDLVGKFVAIKIDRVDSWGLFGTLV